MEKEVLLAGFHAVNARVKLAPETVRIVYVDSHRHDKRMTECRARLQEKGVRVAAVAPGNRGFCRAPEVDSDIR